MPKKLSQKEFLEQVKNYKTIFDFRKVIYINDATKINVICKKSKNNFWITPNNLKHGRGCPYCNHKSKKYSLDEWKNIFYKKYGNKYDLSQIKQYNGRYSKVTVICHKKNDYGIEHGKFQIRASHLLDGHGCPKCNSSLLENEAKELLIQNKIDFKEQYKNTWLGLQSLDFYLPKYKIAIECQGIQHYESREHFGGEKSFKEQKERDARKKEKCKNNGVKLLYFTHYDKIDENGDIYKDKDHLLKRIINESESL